MTCQTDLRHRKTRLLFVIRQLSQGGAERFLYELVKALDRKRFDIAVLTKRRPSEDDYYAPRISELGIPIYRRLPSGFEYVRHHFRPLYLRCRALIELLHRVWARFALGNLLDEFDLIGPIQIENYYTLQPLLENNDRVLVFLMSNAFQSTFNPYDECLPGRCYRFAIFDPAMAKDWSETPCRGAEEIYFPLSMDLSGRPDLSRCARIERPFRIGVFMRLSRERPVSGLFHAFKKLRGRVAAELCFYGRGSPNIFDEELAALGIEVTFNGHAVDLVRTVEHDGLTLGWMTCFGTTLGYGSIEVASLGLPMMFWNLSEVATEEILIRSSGALHAYSDPDELADATVAALANPEALRAAGRRLRCWVNETYDIRSHIGALEEKLEAIGQAPLRRSPSKAG